MRIGFAAPISLQLLASFVADGAALPIGHQFAPAAYWVQELMSRGHHVTVYTSASGIEHAMTFEGVGLRIRIAKLRSWGTGRDLFSFERAQLTQMMKEDQCSLIHAHWTYEYALSALASKLPTLITIHDLPWNVLRFFRDKHRAARLVMAYQTAFAGKHFTAVSEDAGRHFKRFFRPFSNIEIIANGLPPHIFEISAAEGSPRHPTTFASVLQGWSQRKNGAAALRAFKVLRETVPTARYLMFGTDYEDNGPAAQFARLHGLCGGVQFVGLLPYPELIRRLTTDVDIVVHPSLDEAFSMAALESLALRKPLVANRTTPGMSEMLDGGRAGVLVNVNNTNEFAGAMIRLHADTALRSAIATKGHARAARLYRTDLTMALYERAYKKLLAEKVA